MKRLLLALALVLMFASVAVAEIIFIDGRPCIILTAPSGTTIVTCF